MKKFTVYVIKSIEGYRYTGLTEDIDKRLNEHNSKSLSFWTKRGSDWEIIYKEEYENKSDATKREQWLKTGAGRDFINRILNI